MLHALGHVAWVGSVIINIQTLHSTSEQQVRIEMIYIIVDRDLPDVYTNTSSACVSREFDTKNAVY